MGIFSLPKAKPKAQPKEKLYKVNIEPVRESEMQEKTAEVKKEEKT